MRNDISSLLLRVLYGVPGLQNAPPRLSAAHIDNTSLPNFTFHTFDIPLSSSSMFNPFSRTPRGGAAWFNAGPVSSFPDIEADPGPVGQQRKCNDIFTPGCKVFHVPKEDATQATPVAIDDWKDVETDTKDQVMVFQYSGKIAAVNHASTQYPKVFDPG
jgi:hypothetical protein